MSSDNFSAGKKKEKRRKRGVLSTLGYIFIASRDCNICSDYQINHQIAKPIKEDQVGQLRCSKSDVPRSVSQPASLSSFLSLTLSLRERPFPSKDRRENYIPSLLIHRERPAQLYSDTTGITSPLSKLCLPTLHIIN